MWSRRSRNLQLIILFVLVSLVGTLSIAYAILSTTLNITGNSEVIASSWNIHLDNVELNSRSVTNNVPVISDPRTVSFSTTLSKPGDFYEFSIDVVNDGSIDAMIDSVIKTPELSETQKKYLNYIVEYQNGESISTKQLVAKNSFVRLKVKVEFRKDINASDLPTSEETINLSFIVNYVQSDVTGISVKEDGIYYPYKVGNEVCLGNECFYVISSDETSVNIFAKYNLYVGNVCTEEDSNSCTAYGNEATGLQDSTMLGCKGSGVFRGTTQFSSTIYWEGSSNKSYVYDSNSPLYNYVENYKRYLESQDAVIEDARLIKIEELESLGCQIDGTCSEAPKWVYSTTYWTGNISSINYVYRVGTGGLLSRSYTHKYCYGVRPVINVKKTEFWRFS